MKKMPNPKTAAGLALLGAALLMGHSAAWAWGHPGHQLIGSLADELLAGSKAAKSVATILGPGVKNLKTAAPWPDCARSVERTAAGMFVYNDHNKYHSPVCVPFEGKLGEKTFSERRRMEDYVKRNWSNCPGEGTHAPKECHEAYHFTDVAIQRDDYSRAYAGTAEHDIVGALDAALKVLRGEPPDPAFSIKDKKEALLLIAHLVGDLHQPLHVGSVYLSDSGALADPGPSTAVVDPTTLTRGGNKLEIGGDSNLHADWDSVPSNITLGGLATGPGQKRRQVLMAAARAVPATSGPVAAWPATWASDTVLISHQAFPGLRFSRKGALKAGDWAVQFNDLAGYEAAKDRLQTQQVEKAAARLAALLRAVFP